MKVVILAGGFGSRLIEETATLPKPLVEVAGKPILWYIMKLYASQGFNDFIIACGYKGAMIKKYFLDLQCTANDFTVNLAKGDLKVSKRNVPEWKVTLVDTGLETMTGGRIKRLANYIDGDTFMLTYGDGVSNINLRKLLAFHKAHKKKATITAVRMSRFGIVKISDDGSVDSFEEKGQKHSPLINGGYMVLSKDVIDYIRGDKDSFERDQLERLSREKELYAYKHDGFWKCVDTLRDKQELEEIMKSGSDSVRLWRD